MFNFPKRLKVQQVNLILKYKFTLQLFPHLRYITTLTFNQINREKFGTFSTLPANFLLLLLSLIIINLIETEWKEKKKVLHHRQFVSQSVSRRRGTQNIWISRKNNRFWVGIIRVIDFQELKNKVSFM